MKNLLPVAICCSLFVWAAIHESPEDSQANATPATMPADRVDTIRTIEPVTVDSTATDPVPIAADVDAAVPYLLTASAASCSSGSCSAGSQYAARSSRWYPGKQIATRFASRRSAARSSGRWYPGKNLGSLFGRRR